MKHYLFRLKLSLCMFIIFTYTLKGAPQFSEPTTLYLMHSSGNHLKMASNKGGQLEGANASNPQQVTFIPTEDGYYNIQAQGQSLYLALSGSWETTFITNANSDNAKYAIEDATNFFIKLRCKANKKYLGTDGTPPGQNVYSDKSGTSPLHYWFFSDNAKTAPPIDTLSYLVAPTLIRQHFDGWGVSLCWWANMCGKWEDSKIDVLIDWLVSPTGLNYSHFRYNIGGGDDPENRNCTLHHMSNGKGLRAEMEGFKDFSDDTYHWERDEAQRNIMLKIREKRPDAVFEAFSNSAPYYMTYSGCVAGNENAGSDNLRPEYYEEFAHYLVDICKHYKEVYGIEFKTLEPFNEPETDYWHANGTQEGCHFDTKSQIKFLQILASILKESGLNTIISASDETKVGQSVTDFKQYQAQNVLSLVGQWNTHSYSATNSDRTKLAQLAHQAEIPLWMSEVGAGGNGIEGNLNLAKILFDDMRYMQPETWIDWQYMEENNDQWCTVTGSFEQQTFNKVKNYYIRQQCSRFILHGYNIVTSLNNNSLAAINPTQDTLVIVLLNEGTKNVHNINLSAFNAIPSKTSIKAYRTSQTENLRRITDFETKNSCLVVTMPEQSIATFVIPIEIANNENLTELTSRCQYLIVPRHEMECAITADINGNITIEKINGAESQLWTLQEEDGNFTFENALGQYITAHRSSSNTSLTAEKGSNNEQTFYIETVDFPYYKILSTATPTYAFDLVNEKSTEGTVVGLWDYNAGSTTPTHRQWMFVPIPQQTNNDATSISILEKKCHSEKTSTFLHDGIYDLSGRKVNNHSHKEITSEGIYIIVENGISRKVIK